MKKVYKKKIAAITGSSGVLAKTFIKKYKKKFQFRIFKDRIENKKKIIKWLTKNNDIEIFIHCAAISTIKEAKKNPKKTLLINSWSTISLLKVINNMKLKKFNYFLFISSSQVYKPSIRNISESSKRVPKNIYGVSKKIVEDFIIKNKKKFYFQSGIARIFNFYSKKHKRGFFIPDIIYKIENKVKELNLDKINIPRDYLNVDMICKILFYIIEKKINFPINVGSGKKLYLLNLIKQILIKKKSNIKLIYNKKKFPGLVANITLLRKIGFKTKFRNFIIL